MSSLLAAARLLVPPLCAGCGRRCEPDAVICRRCVTRLDAGAPLYRAGSAGVDAAWASCVHDGVARQLVAALKFRRLLPVAEVMADRIRRLAPAGLLSGALVPVPAAPLRYLSRGFDPPREVALALGEPAGLELCDCLRRRDGGRQVGRRRGERLGKGPQVRLRRAAPRSAVLIDDVMTTGATIAACAYALRRAGSARVVAVTFSRRL